MSVAKNWSTSEVQTFPAPWNLVHDASCASAPTLELPLATSVVQLDVTGALRVNGVDVTGSSGSSGSCSGVPWVTKCYAQHLDLASVDSAFTGFAGGFATSDHAYYVPNDSGARHGNVVRISVSDFSSSGVEHFDLASVDSNLMRFNGGFATSDHAYYVGSTSTPHGNTVRLVL